MSFQASQHVFRAWQLDAEKPGLLDHNQKPFIATCVTHRGIYFGVWCNMRIK